jgi:hypothetical protein
MSSASSDPSWTCISKAGCAGPYPSSGNPACRARRSGRNCCLDDLDQGQHYLSVPHLFRTAWGYHGEPLLCLLARRLPLQHDAHLGAGGSIIRFVSRAVLGLLGPFAAAFRNEAAAAAGAHVRRDWTPRRNGFPRAVALEATIRRVHGKKFQATAEAYRSDSMDAKNMQGPRTLLARHAGGPRRRVWPCTPCFGNASPAGVRAGRRHLVCGAGL